VHRIEDSDQILKVLSTLKLYGAKNPDNCPDRIMDRVTESMKL
jgi:hypothetical protein